MKTIHIALLLLIVNVASAQNHTHHIVHAKKNDKQVEIKKRFIPTNDLKIRMEKVLSIMKELNRKKDDIKSIKEYGVKLTEIVNDIFKTCKLEPDADAAIHPSLGLILDGAVEFKNGRYESGHKKIHEALLDYEKIFEHEGWNH